MISPFAPWYRTGTVSVTNNSATVTGVATGWTTGQQIRPGDLFTINSSKFYEVLTVNSATSITLRTPYLEATAATQSYAVIRNFAVVPATELINRTLDTVYIWKNFQDQMYEWQNKPYNAITPATVTFTALDETVTVVKSLPQCVGEMNIQQYKGFIELNLFGPAASTQAIAFNNKAYYQATIDKNTTLTFTAPAQSARLILVLVRSGSSNYTVTFPATVRDRNGVALTSVTLTAAQPTQVLEFLWNGTNYYRING